jgi:hypothetical protein
MSHLSQELAMLMRTLGLAIVGLTLGAVYLNAGDEAKYKVAPDVQKEQILTLPTKVLREQIPTMPAKILREQIPTPPTKVLKNPIPVPATQRKGQVPTLPTGVTPKERIPTLPTKGKKLELPKDAS